MNAVFKVNSTHYK